MNRLHAEMCKYSGQVWKSWNTPLMQVLSHVRQLFFCFQKRQKNYQMWWFEVIWLFKKHFLSTLQNSVCIRAGYHQVSRDTILSRYFAHDNNNITIQLFCDNRYIARNFIHDICVTEEIHNLLTALNPFHRNTKHWINFSWMTAK